MGGYEGDVHDALIKETKNKASAEKFLTYLQGEEAGKVFEKFGFVVKH